MKRKPRKNHSLTHKVVVRLADDDDQQIQAGDNNGQKEQIEPKKILLSIVTNLPQRLYRACLKSVWRVEKKKVNIKNSFASRPKIQYMGEWRQEPGREFRQLYFSKLIEILEASNRRDIKSRSLSRSFDIVYWRSKSKNVNKIKFKGPFNTEKLAKRTSKNYIFVKFK